MIKTLSDLEKVLEVLARHGVEEAQLHMTMENSSRVGTENGVVLTSKSVPITLKLFPKRHNFTLPDTFKPNDIDDSDTSDDDLYHST